MKKIYVLILALLIVSITATAIIASSNEKLSVEDDFNEFHTKNSEGQGVCISPNLNQEIYETNVLGVRI